MPVSMSDNEPWYLIEYTPAKPSAKQNLTELYGLSELAATVARFDPATGEKRKLRKSYKNHIKNDLSGTHNIPDSSAGSGFSLLDLARKPPSFDPASHQAPPLMPPIDQRQLSSALSLDKTPATGLPDFDVTLLASPNWTKQQQEQQQQQQQQQAQQASTPGNQSGHGRSGSQNGFKNQRFANVQGATTGGESSNDDGTGFKRKKKKRKENSASGYEDGGDAKRRKV